MTEEEIAPSTSPISTDHKRKLEDLVSETPNPEVSSPSPVKTSLTDSTVNGNANADDLENPSEKVQEISDGQTDEPEAKKPRLDEESHDSEPDQQVQKIEAPLEGDLQPPSKETVQEAVDAPQMEALGNIQPDGTAQHPSVENSELDLQELKVLATPDEDLQPPPEEIQEAADAVDPSTGDVQPDGTAQFSSVVNDTQSDMGVPPPDNAQPLDQSEPDSERMTRRMEVPNNKVGVLIGKAGDTIRFLQYNSGAKIQITRDAESDPYSTSRQVELIGSLENVNKAEQLIKDVIAEADAGGSPSLVARGFGTPQSGAEQIQIQVLNEKVGMIIGKGGETIKNLQTKSGAHIQLVPQHLAEGDQPKERTVRVTGTKKQIESARDMIKEVMSQTLARPSPLSGGYAQQNFRPRGHAGPSQWGPTRGPPTQSQPSSYNYPQRGMYPSQTQQYPTQTYNGYPQQQPAPRSSYNMGWEQRPPTHMQGQPPQSGGYGYYGQGGPPASGNPALVSSPAPGPAPSQQNYNYGHPQGSEYGQPPPGFSHSVPQQSYENQVPSQHSYGSQQGYPQQTHAPSGYGQPPYVRPGYGMQPSQGPPQSYGPPRAAQPGDMPQYQTPINPSYGSSGQPPQQSYPYGSSGPSYGPTPTANDVYAQQASFSAPGYAQQGGATPYVQQGVPSQPGYAQGGQAGAYGQYPSSQPGYGEQPHPTQSNPSYGGYQGSADGGYGNGQGSAYGIPQGGGQAGYVQPNSNPPSYDQSMPQSVYGSHAATAPAGYTKSLSPQPAYAQQYESGQMYGQAHH